MTKIVQIKQTRIQREKRLLIQKAALQVFSEFGLRGATLDKIAKACGLTKPNILYYYSSKDEIYAEVLQSLIEEWIRPLKDISENENESTEKENPDLENSDEILKMLDEEKKKRHILRAWVSPDNNRAIDPLFKDNYGDYRAGFVRGGMKASEN